MLGINRSGDFRNGNPVTLPKTFGNAVDWTPSPSHFGNAVPSNGHEQNAVNWTLSPSHFGNTITP
jgi:hypothetical protein